MDKTAARSIDARMQRLRALKTKAAAVFTTDYHDWSMPTETIRLEQRPDGSALVAFRTLAGTWEVCDYAKVYAIDTEAEDFGLDQLAAVWRTLNTVERWRCAGAVLEEWRVAQCESREAWATDHQRDE